MILPRSRSRVTVATRESFTTLTKARPLSVIPTPWFASCTDYNPSEYRTNAIKVSSTKANSFPGMSSSLISLALRGNIFSTKSCSFSCTKRVARLSTLELIWSSDACWKCSLQRTRKVERKRATDDSLKTTFFWLRSRAYLQIAIAELKILQQASVLRSAILTL